MIPVTVFESKGRVMTRSSAAREIQSVKHSKTVHLVVSCETDRLHSINTVYSVYTEIKCGLCDLRLIPRLVIDGVS